MRLSQKLIAAITAVTVISIIATSSAAIYIASNHSKVTANNQISSLADGRRNQLNTFLQSISSDLESFANSKLAVSSLNLFVSGIEFADPTTLAENLSAIYLSENKTEEELKEIAKNSKLSIYTKNHKKQNDKLLTAADDIDAQNLHLTDSNGILIYSSIKRNDFGSNLINGQFKSSPLAGITSDVLSNLGNDSEFFKDFQIYQSNNGNPTAFLARPILRKDELKGVAIIELPMEKINEILSNDRGLGETGETVLLRGDGVLLSDSKFTPENDVLNTQIQTDIIEKTEGFDVQTGTLTEYRNIVSDVGFARIQFSDASWYVATIIDHSEAAAGIEQMRNAVIVIAVTLLVVSLALAFWIARSLARPIHSIITSMNELAEGNTSIKLTYGGRKDEVGDIVRAVQHFKEAAIEKLDLENETKLAEEESNIERDRQQMAKEEEDRKLQAAVAELAQGLKNLAEGDLISSIDAEFEVGMEPLRQNFNISVQKLHDTMCQIATTAGTIKINSSEISNATLELSGRTEHQAASLEETAAALTELTESVQQASQNANESAKLAQIAKSNTNKSGVVVTSAVDAMERIEKASQGISSIIEVIEALSFQTNLLALNAGVEAARAGEAGKGFAVVAQEVRELASRSSEAAQQIKTLIDTSNKEVEQGVVLVRETGEVLKEISDQVSSVENQITSIAKSSDEQLESIQSVNASVNKMDQRTQQNAAMAEESTAATQNLDYEIQKLSKMVDAFNVAELSEIEDLERVDAYLNAS